MIQAGIGELVFLNLHCGGEVGVWGKGYEQPPRRKQASNERIKES